MDIEIFITLQYEYVSYNRQLPNIFQSSTSIIITQCSTINITIMDSLVAIIQNFWTKFDKCTFYPYSMTYDCYVILRLVHCPIEKGVYSIYNVCTCFTCVWRPRLIFFWYLWVKSDVWKRSFEI